MRWTHKLSLAELNQIGRGSAAGNVGMKFTMFSEDWLEATIPLNEYTRDRLGQIHTGALAILAESIGSVAASLTIDAAHNSCVGQSLSIHHPVAVLEGPISARASLISAQERSQLWNIEMKDPHGVTVCVAALTMAILSH
jgi:1,4-dihydroxy-2-naphthoyl-CoA hydrolase